MRRNTHRDHHGQNPPGPSQRRNLREHYTRGRSAGSSKSTRSSSSWLDGKLKQGPTSKDIETLQSTTASPVTRSLTISPEEAFTLAEQALQGNVRTQIYCLEFPRTPMKTEHKQILPFRVFNEIDREFFRSMLKGNVSLGWKKLRDGVLSQTRRAELDGNPRIRIELSPQLLQNGRRWHILASLIHQMIHAYYLQCCGYGDQEGCDLGHGQAFLALLKCIGEHCEPLREFLSPDLRVPYLGRRGHHNVHNGSSSNPVAGVSSCYVRSSRFNGVNIQNWRNTAVAKTLSLQEMPKSSGTSQSADDKLFPKTVYFVTREGVEEPPLSLKSLSSPREAYFFLRFQDRHYPVLRSSVTDLAALSNSPHFKDKAFLQLPPRTSLEDFLTFYIYLVHRGYPPSWKDAYGQVAAPSKGPPAIRSYSASVLKPLLQLVTAFHLGEQLKYRPFDDHVLNGLRDLPATSEDPMAVLEKIYDSPSSHQSSSSSTSYKSADPQLREWVITWLSVGLLSSGMGQHEMKYKTNLGVLRHDPHWSQRLIQLKGKSSAFGQDEELANRTICQKYGVANICDIGVPISLQQTLAPPAPPCFSPVQQPTHIPGWFPLPSDHAGPQWGNNRVYPLGENHDAFDISGLRDSLPMDRIQGLGGKRSGLAREVYSPEQQQALSFWLRQHQAPTSTSADSGSILEEYPLLRQVLPELYPWIGVNWRQGN